MSDPINHPDHYTRHPSGVECITVTEHMNFCVGNAFKYLWRAGLKGNELEDLKKARWYIDREIARSEATTPFQEYNRQSLSGFQSAALSWAIECFGNQAVSDPIERSHRLTEEALELSQAVGCSKDDAHMLVDYVFNRPKGEIAQEVGGVIMTLSVLCGALNVDLADAGNTELARVWEKLSDIREKQQSKPKNSPLPGSTNKGADNG